MVSAIVSVKLINCQIPELILSLQVSWTECISLSGHAFLVGSIIKQMLERWSFCLGNCTFFYWIEILSLYFWLPNHNLQSWIFIPGTQDYNFQVYFTYVLQISKSKLNFFYPPKFPVVTQFFLFIIVQAFTKVTQAQDQEVIIHSFMYSFIC